MATRHDDAMAVALEHVKWRRAGGATPAEIIEALPERHRPAAGDLTWDDAVAAVARAWLELRVW